MRFFFGILMMLLVRIEGIGFEINLKPNCRHCKWNIPNNNLIYDTGYCSLYSNKINFPNANIIIYKSTIQCRLNGDLCGMDGLKFEKKYINDDVKKIEREIDEIESNLNGEINEKSEIKEIEEEIDMLRNKIKQLQQKL